MSAANDVKGFVAVVAEFIPRLVGAVVVLLAALLLARLLQHLVTRTLDRFGLDSLFEQTGASETLWKVGYSGGPSYLLGISVFWGTILTGIAGALSILGLASLESTMTQLINLSGRTLVALVIVIAGIMAAGWLSETIARSAERAGLRGTNIFRRVVFVTVLALALLLAAAQLGLNTSLLTAIALALLATLGLVAALALGQGLVPLSGNVAASRYVQDGMQEGDFISVNGIEGTVEELGYASVTIRAENDDVYRIPNRTLLENIVRTRSRP
ncbi:MAG: mechanosensitive ion channel domain-containing protein [Rubrobacteraceae bacterium]